MATGRVPTTANSPLTAKGDLFGYSTTQARVPVGNDGETLVADSSASTGLRWTATPTASNPVINGGFDIWQRGTTFSNAVTNTYTADRWTYGRGGNVSGQTLSRQATGDTTNLPNIQYCARSQRAAGDTSTQQLHIVYNMETVDSIPYAGKTITFSFYARRGANYSSTSNNLDVIFQTGTGTDQNIWSGYSGAVTDSYNVTLSTTWQRFTRTITLPSTATQIGFYFRQTPTGTAGANDWYDVTGVQIDVGNTALPFRRTGNTLAGELAACQRYYYRNAGGKEYSHIGFGMAFSTTQVAVEQKLPVTMRVVPTSIEYSNVAVNLPGAGNTAITSLAIVSAESSPDIVQMTAVVASGLTQYRPYYLLNNNNTAGYVGYNAEL